MDKGMKEIILGIKSMDRESSTGRVETTTKEATAMTRGMGMERCTSKMAQFTKGSGREDCRMVRA